MGISNRYHFAWLCEALAQFEDATGYLASLRREGRELVLWCFGEQSLIPPIQFLREALGRDAARVTLFDKFPRQPGVIAQDINALGNLPDNSCDIFTLFRASYFVTDPPAFLAQMRRVLRPRGLAFIDWLHGLSDAPVLDLRGDPLYGGAASPYTTTYADPPFLAEFPREFEAFIRHLNHPPRWVDVASPGRRVPVAERVRRLLGSGPRRHVTPESYLDALRADLAGAGKHLIEPGLMEQYFKVAFRHARYFHPFVRKFNLYLLTVLEPVGKEQRWTVG